MYIHSNPLLCFGFHNVKKISGSIILFIILITHPSKIKGLTELEILDTFYKETGGSKWSDNSNWQKKNVCSRYGVTCHAQLKTVTRLILDGNKLEGTVPESLFQLPSLHTLDLGRNNIDVDLSFLKHATQLEYLYLESTLLSSFNGIELASGNITSIHLSNNDFKNAPISHELFRFPSLTHLIASNCNLSGTIPQVLLHDLEQLEEIDISQNNFEGPLPEFNVGMNNMISINFAENQFTGRIPTSLSSLINLEYLNLSKQQSKSIKGKLPSFLFLTQLNHLLLDGNSLRGEIPTDFIGGISNPETRSVTVRLSNNQLSGNIPQELSRFTYLDLYVEGNKIQSISPELCMKDQWMSGRVRDYGCDGILCPPGTANSIGRQISDSTACETCKDLLKVSPYLGSTECVEAEFTDRDILTKLYRDTDGDAWRYNQNWTTSESICDWIGIECVQDDFEDDLIEEDRVQSIDLRNNNLKGTVPSTIFYLRHLNDLDLGENKIDLSFDKIDLALSLEHLYVDKTLISSLDGISKISSQLLTLYAGKNDYAIPKIPDEIYKLKKLRTLNLVQNDFRGSISKSIGLLTDLRILDLMLNYLTGTIPSAIGKLSSLRVLSLTDNSLTGTIPNELNDLIFISSLYLDNQIDYGSGLSGTIPSFSSASDLSKVYLSENALSGNIPPDLLSNFSFINDTITLDFSTNLLTGGIPIELERFENLNLFVARNKIDSIPPNLCEKEDWNNGEVGLFGCDGILCESGKANKYGRQISYDNPCEECSDSRDSLFFGGTKCILTDIDQIRENEKSNLEELYQKTGGDDWDTNTGWLDDPDICNWYGITCDNESFVSALDLSNNNLVGKTPRAIFLLRNVQEIDLSLNSIEFNFVGIGQAKKLTSLNLHEIGLSSVDGLRKAKYLEDLNLEKNDFRGDSIPDEIFELANLKNLYLAESNLGGTISDDIAYLTKLNGIYLNGNELTGQIPEFLGDLVNLEWIALADNKLSGTLPLSLNGLKNLKALSLSDQLSKGGNGISGKLIDFSQNENLSSIFINSNKLSGSIPASFLSKSDNTKLYSIDLSDNVLTGVIPGELSRFDRISIDLTKNHIVGIDPELCKKETWMDRNVALYQCDAIICPAGTYNKYGRRQSDENECKECKSTYRTQYLGSTTCELPPLSEREILELLFNECGGLEWTESTNWMEKDKDFCSWFGIQCNDEGSVFSIVLGSNNLIGKLPPYIFSLPSLNKLLLYSNPLDITFEGIERAKDLEVLALDSTGLKSIEGIGNARSLTELNIRFNSLSGPLPDELFQLRNLQTLYVSDNDFTGHLPPYFGNFTSITTIVLGSNLFSGRLPEFAHLQKIEHLDLSNNLIKGTIPEDFLPDVSDFSADIFIDLSSNELSGEIPQGLGRFEAIQLHLKSNKFSSIHPDLCELEKWNYNDVKNFGCDGILCPRRTYNLIGRQSDANTPCVACRTAKYLGSTSCAKRSSRSLAYGVLLIVVAAVMTFIVAWFMCRCRR